MKRTFGLLMMLVLLMSVMRAAVAIPSPGSPSIQPANGYATISANSGNPLDINVTATKPGFGVFWTAIFPPNGSSASLAPVANSEGWATQNDSSAAVWRTNTSNNSGMLVPPGTYGYSNLPSSCRFVGSGRVSSCQYICHVCNLSNGNTFWCYPDQGPPAGANDDCNPPATTGQGNPIPINVLGNDVSPNKCPLKIVSVTQGIGGIVTIAPDGQSVIYSPKPGFCGNDSFTYKVTATDCNHSSYCGSFGGGYGGGYGNPSCGTWTDSAKVCVVVTCNPPPCNITGPKVVCPNSTNTYTDAGTTTGVTHKWTITGAGTIIGSNTGSSVTVKAGGCNTGFHLCINTSQTCYGGTSSNCCIDVVAQDKTPPTLSGQGANTTIECSGTPQFTPPTAKDDCDPSPTVIQSGPDVRTDLGCGYKVTRTWVAKDACGNTSAPVSQTITVADTKAPVPPTAPADVNGQCDGDVPPPVNLTANDACAGPITVAPVDGPKVADTGDCGYTIIRTWTFKDPCNNTSSVSQKIHIQDTKAPVPPTAPGDVNGQCDGDVPPPVNLTANDACAGPITVAPVDGPKVADTGDCGYTIIRTWTFKDPCNNTSSVSQKIHIQDTKAPVPPTAPGDVNGQCDGDVPPPVNLTANDACAGPITVAPVDGPKVADTGDCGYTIIRTWTFKDPCNNTSSVSQKIHIQDTTKPTITCPGDIVVPVGGSTDPSVTGTATATDNCDSNPAVTYTDDSRPGSCGHNGIIVRTWKATDACGNSSTCPQVITVTQPTTITGNATICANGTVVAGATITLTDSSNNVVATTTTAPGGSYSFSGSYNGTFTITAQSPYNGMTVSGTNPITVQLVAGQCYTDNFCYEQPKKCSKFLIIGVDHNIIGNMVTKLIQNGYVQGTDFDVVFTPNTYDATAITKVLDAKINADGSPYCTVFFDTEFVGQDGHSFSPPSDADQQRLHDDILAGMGFVYAQPYNAGSLFGFGPHNLGQLPNVLPVEVSDATDPTSIYTFGFTGGVPTTDPFRYSIVGPTFTLPTTFSADIRPDVFNLGQPTLAEQVPGVTYFGWEVITKSITSNPSLAGLPGMGGPTTVRFTYGASGGRVAIIGTAPFNPSASYNVDIDTVSQLYVNALKWTAGN